MAELGFAPDLGAGWGAPERLAFDRALALPTLFEQGAGVERRFPRLSRTIETEIIPRLLLAHREDRSGPRATEAGATADPAGVATLAGLTIAAAPDAAREHVAALLKSGRSVESILLDVMAPTARLLGDMWREDLCTFTDVTIGLSRLQAILRWLGPTFEPGLPGDGAGRILLVPAPGEQHTFGVAVLEGLFQQQGWVVDNASGLGGSEVRAILRDGWFDVLGVSLSCDVLLPGFANFISGLRKASKNRAVHVMVGGRFFQDHAERGLEFGADTVAFDATDALRKARSVTCVGVSRGAVRVS